MKITIIISKVSLIIGGVYYIANKIGKDIWNARIECNKLNL